jgi:hypothetical protein
MAMISPSEGKKFERDPQEGNIPTGLYLCELSRVQETGPSAKFPNGNPRLVFEFTILDGACKGKKAVAFLGKTLLKNKEGRESNLVKWARMMGVPDPEKGFDPDGMLNKRFNVMIELTPGTNGEPPRGWARSVIAANNPAPAAPPASAPPGDGPPPDEATGPDPAAKWDYHDGAKWVANQTTAEVQQSIVINGLMAQALWVRPAGSKDAKKADDFGFTNATVETIPY